MPEIHVEIPEGHELLALLKCGCRMTTDGQDLHSWSCCAAHDDVLTDACQAAAREAGIPFQEVRDQ